MQTKCSIKVFQFRYVNRPGILILDEEQEILEFSAYGLTDSDSFQKVIPIQMIKKVELAKGILKDTLAIYYEDDWYKWTDFLDDHYQAIYQVLQQKMS